LGPNHWIYVYSELSPKDKAVVEEYYSTLYPRSYVRKLVAFLDRDNVQFKKSQNYRRDGAFKGGDESL
jgi:hypothetical protein